MRSCCAVYVDVGYLLASAGTRVTGSSLRSGVEVDYSALIVGLVEQVQSHSGLPLLRVNWYDSGGRPGGMPDYQQDQIGLLPRLKLRLGRLSYAGEQKGVDVRIGLDLVLSGRDGVTDVIYLVSGDDDLTEAVEEAQSNGAQVFLLAVPDHVGNPHGVSKHLQRAADGVLLIDAATIDMTVRSRALPEGLVPGAPAPDAPAQAPDSTEAAATEQAAAPAPAAPSVPSSENGAAPSPAMFARRKATRLQLPSVPPWPAPAGPGAGDDAGIARELVDAVAGQVVASWCVTATPTALAELTVDRPTIPADLDRALLVDLSSRGGVYEIDDATRHDVRARFWYHVDRVQMQ